MILATVMRRVFKFGNVTLIDSAGKRYPICQFGGPLVVIRLVNSQVARRLVSTSSMAWCEAYMNGDVIFEEGGLAAFLEVWGRSEMHIQASGAGELLRRACNLSAAFSRYNSKSLARRNVAHHYDLSAELYDCFLDSDRQYSCAYFPAGNEDLETAQLLKKRHIAAKLLLDPGMKVLDIGCGWGGLALYLAKNFDCEVVGVTLSEEQYKLSTLRIKAAGLEQRVTIELCDYRNLSETFDRVVSVGMLEHVGQYQFDEFFSKLKHLLKPDGVALIHSIGRMGKPEPIGGWIKKYIFPGAYLPSASQLMIAIEGQQLWLTDLENLRLHYSKTLKCWYQRFREHRDYIAGLYDERFCRMWEMYLLGCEMTFRVQNITVFQLQLSRQIDAVPMSRDYIMQRECQLADTDQAIVELAFADRGNKPAIARTI